MLAQWRRLHCHAPSTLSQQKRHITDLRPFQPGDLVLLREKLNRTAPPILTRPLKAGKQVQSHRGIIKHDDLIGKRVRDLVTTQFTQKNGPTTWKVGTEFRLHEVKLEEYVRLSRRLVTPVYPSDARLIVELLDLHPAQDEEGDEKLEILEAGTGHGALTLYLSRAIHGANTHTSNHSTAELQDGMEEDTRRAIIHTLDISAKYSAHARDVVKGFRHGLYYPNIDFHVSNVSAWLQTQLSSSTRLGNPFLSHAILDLPNSDQHLAQVAEALRVDGTLVVFNPSITQITACAAKIRAEGLPLELERVVELPTNGEAGGREWKVSAVRPRAAVKSDADEGRVDEGAVEEDTTETEGGATGAAASQRKEGGWQMVCRPKVGDRIVGGGFLGVWKKQRDN